MYIVARFITTMAAAVLLIFAALPAAAATTDLEIVGETTGLVLKPKGNDLFNLQNMNPGDSRQAAIMLRNNHEKSCDLWLRAEDVTTEEPSLFEVMKLTVSYRGKPLYEGPVSGFAGDKEIYLGSFQPGEYGELTVIVGLPGPETGNIYQGKRASVKWLFTARADEAVAEKPAPRTRLPQTFGRAAPYLLTLLGSLLLAAGLLVRRHKPG